MSRARWTALSDEQMLAQCEVDTYRASGPGGQKRNKTSSAVRLRHPPSGLIVIAEESRSQHENRARALRRLRQALYLRLREGAPAAGAAEHPDVRAARGADGRLDLGRKDPRFWPAVGVVLDVLAAAEARVHHVENHGVEKVVTLRADDHLFNATIPAIVPLAIDSLVRFAWDPAKLHILDAETGVNLL